MKLECIIKDKTTDTTIESKNKNLGTNLTMSPYKGMQIISIDRKDSEHGWLITYLAEDEK